MRVRCRGGKSIDETPGVASGTPRTRAHVGTADLSVVEIYNRKKGYAVKLYLPPVATAEKDAAAAPLYIFAVGTSFTVANYKEFGECLASHGIVAAIFDYELGRSFKTHKKFFTNVRPALEDIYARAALERRGIRMDASPGGLIVGGHSKGGAAALIWATSNPGLYGAISLWDPVDVTSSVEYRLPPDVRMLMSTPVESGCSLFINDRNNGRRFYDMSHPKDRIRLVRYDPPVAHNSIASSGIVGRSVCYARVESFIPTYAKNAAEFMLDATTVG